MNNARRNELRKAMELLGQAHDIIESMRDEEQDAFDNMPEGIQYSERGEHMEEMISVMDDALCSLDEIADSMNDEVIEC